MCLQTKGSYDFTLQSFESYSEYMDHTIKERMTQTTISFGFAIPGVAEFGFNYNNAKFTKAEQKIRRASGKVRCLFLLLTSLQPNDLSKNKTKGFIQTHKSSKHTYKFLLRA